VRHLAKAFEKADHQAKQVKITNIAAQSNES